MPIRSEAVIEVSESDYDSDTSQTASDWIGAFKGPNSAPRGSLAFGFASSPHALTRARMLLVPEKCGPRAALEYHRTTNEA